MFGSGHDSGHENNRGLVPMRFVWPYGGRSVSLCGSFTRWSDHISMSPIEGCPTVFQVVCRLTPGQHQYKFFVDGEWRHDEHQPVQNESYGVVNTVFLHEAIDTIPATFSPEIPGAHMELDDISAPVEEVIPSISETDVEVSHQRILTFLSTHDSYELLPESGKVIALDVDLPVKQAFHILYEQGISMAPLWDCRNGRFVGVLSPEDFILILKELGNHGSNLTEEELETHSISAWKEAKLQLNGQVDGDAGAHPLIHAGPTDSLQDVAQKILRNRISMVPIIYSSSQDGSFPQLLHLASLAGILKCVCRHFKHSASSLPILQQPICSFPMGTWVPKIGESSSRPFAMLRPNASLGSALSLLVQAEVSSIPIVDDNDSLLDIYSRSDITALANDRAYLQISLEEISIRQALQLGQDASSPHGFQNGQRCHMCLRSDPLHKVMERLANPGVRRVVIVEAGTKRVEGIISLRDLFRFLLG